MDILFQMIILGAMHVVEVMQIVGVTHIVGAMHASPLRENYWGYSYEKITNEVPACA